MKKKIDDRIIYLIKNCNNRKHRGIILVVGDRGKDLVANIHSLLCKEIIGPRPNILWCYNKEVGFSS